MLSGIWGRDMEDSRILSTHVPRPVALLVDTCAAHEGMTRSAWIRRAIEQAAERRAAEARPKRARRRETGR